MDCGALTILKPVSISICILFIYFVGCNIPAIRRFLHNSQIKKVSQMLDFLAQHKSLI